MSCKECCEEKGEMNLYYSLWESSYGHVEDNHPIIIKPKDEKEHGIKVE